MSEGLGGLGLDPRRSISYLYGPRQVVEGARLTQREEFCREVLGTPEMEGSALELGCGIGFWTAALAGRYDQVVALDRSRTHAIIAAGGLYALGRHNATVFAGTLPELAADGEESVRPRKRSFSLVTSFDGLRRHDVLNLSILAEYTRDTGMVLVAFPAWWFGGGSSELEGLLYERGLAAGWNRQELPNDGALEKLDGGEAPGESVSLGYAAAMSGLTDLYDFRNNRPAPTWRGPGSFEVAIEWRLYHLPADSLRPPLSEEDAALELDLEESSPVGREAPPPPPPR